jgi:enoyl-CoA hydratase/carnithine racemase
MPTLSGSVLRLLWRMTRRLLSVPGALRLAETAASPAAQSLIWVYRWRRTILRMNRSNTVYIAAVNGPATGGGHAIALACDLRFASDAPHIRLGQIESLAGLIPGGGGSQRLPRMIGTAKALEHMLEGAPLTAQQALELGLINAIVADADLLAYAQRTAARLGRRSPTAVQWIKRLTYFNTSEPFSTALDSEVAGFVTAGLQPAMKSTLHAFIADLAEYQDSPLSTGVQSWIDGTRTDQTG